MKNVLMIGGDSRNKEVAEILCEKGHQVSVIGYDTCEFTVKNITHGNHEDFSKSDAIILPVHGTTEDGNVYSTYSEHRFQLTTELIAQTPSHCKVFSGITNDFLNNTTKERQLEVIFARDDIAIYNSISTAEATLHIAIEETDYTVHGAHVAVIGFGRVGFTVARLFKNVGAYVTVFARKDRDIARITEMGLNAARMHRLAEEINKSSICINTVPHPILDEPVLTNMDMDTLIIDLASAPGGTDFKFAREKGINAIHALGLPGKTAPKSAGKILADTILHLL